MNAIRPIVVQWLLLWMASWAVAGCVVWVLYEMLQWLLPVIGAMSG